MSSAFKMSGGGNKKVGLVNSWNWPGIPASVLLTQTNFQTTLSAEQGPRNNFRAANFYRTSFKKMTVLL